MVESLQVWWSFAVCVAYLPGGLPPSAEIGRWTVLGLGPALFGLRNGRWNWLIWGVLGWGLVGLAWTPAFGLGLGEWWKFATVLLLLLTELDLDSVRFGVAAGLVVSDGFLVLQLLGWHPVQEVAPPSGLFMNRDVLGELAAFGGLWGICRFRWLSVGAAALPIVVCESRVAWGTLAVGLLVKLRWTWWWISGAIAVAALPLWFAPGKMESALARLDGWGLGWKLLTARGLGLGFFQYVAPDRQVVHSDLLEWGDEIGLIGIGLLVVWGLLRIRPKADEAPLVVAALLVVGLAFPMHLPANAMVVAAILGSRGAGIRNLLDLGRSRNAPLLECPDGWADEI